MAAEDEREVLVERRVVEDNRPSGSLAAVFIVLGVIAAVAFGWWAIGTTPVPGNRVSQAPPGATSPDTTIEPRTTVPEGRIQGKAM